ncbi:FecR family protein [Dawidia soli]|uniref:FecR domain-containing protein n=1 Tax=Dawidia soli TaxID=2782352 RepID=A0AAP2DAB9_9BACT|nr:FecR family protein [Dawidia soli]MBT1688059.1 FecR domain-containing protein [Dawidia soli]
MTPEAFKELLTRYCQGQCTPQEEALVQEWYNTIDTNGRQALPEEQRIILEAKAWRQLSARLRDGRPPRHHLLLKIAACLTLFLLAAGGWYYFTPTPHAEVSTITAETLPAGWSAEHNSSETPRMVSLTDGSRVMLYPGSTLCFPQTFRRDQREVTLLGEGFFDVQRDTLRPFLVYTQEVTTRVLGTSFTIKAYENAPEITVAVATGRVAVYKQRSRTNQDAAAVVLSPNQQAVYSRQNDRVKKALVAHPRIIPATSANPTMSYDAAPVTSIFQALEESYGVDFVYDENTLAGCSLTTTLTDEDLYARIRIVCEAIGADYIVQDTSIVITGTGCP